MDKEKHQLWTNRLHDLKASGLPGTEWCRKHGIPENQLWYWKKKLVNAIEEKESSNAKSPSWIALDMVKDETDNKGSITIRLGAVEIEVKSGYDADLLRNVVNTLVNPC